MAQVTGSVTVGGTAYPCSAPVTLPGSGPAPVTHGAQLSVSSVGPWALQGVPKGSETLTAFDWSSYRLSNWPGWGTGWIPGTAYVYNNNPANHGGIVPAGGMVIDGYSVPGGTWVTQFYDFSNHGSMTIEGDVGNAYPPWPGVMFRGCRFRQALMAAPGIYGNGGHSNGGIIWFLYCDGGGTSVTLPNVCESVIESNGVGSGRDHQYVIRCYLSAATTLAFGRNNGDAFIENYGETVIPYYTGTQWTTYHMNGLCNSGGQDATLWLRNNLAFSPQPPGAAEWHPPNDVIQMAADGGAYPGTGLNMDGSRGYQIRDNYLGGADHTLQLGVDKGNTPAMVSSVVVTGNKFTTRYHANIGWTSVAYKVPSWGVQGSAWSGNTFADDYGTGDWSPAPGNSARQYPAGNGPRAGTAVPPP